MRSQADLGSVLAIQGARPIGGCSPVVRTGWATALLQSAYGTKTTALAREDDEGFHALGRAKMRINSNMS